LLATLLDDTDLAACSDLRIDITLHDETTVAAVAARARRRGGSLRVWLKLDSGMHRIGLNPEEFVRADRLLACERGIEEVTHMTHFSSARDVLTTSRQLSCFWTCHQVNPKAKVSLANSAALIARPETHADWVRPGIMLYGANPLGANEELPLRSAMTLSARVVGMREIPTGEPVGYGGRWTSARPSRIGTIGILGMLATEPPCGLMGIAYL